MRNGCRPRRGFALLRRAVQRPEARAFARSIWTAIVILCLVGCGYLHPVVPASQVLPLGLSAEEYPLKDRPPVDESRSFVPVEGMQEQVLSKRQKEREVRPNRPSTDQVLLGSDRLAAITQAAAFGRVSIQVSRNGQAIYTVRVGDSSPVPTFRGLWAYGNHWVLETAHVARKLSFSNVIDFNVWGEIIEDEISLNKRYGYQESFGFQMMAGKPFYFFKRHGRLGISYDGQEIPLGYMQILHYGCCSASALNPWVSANMVAFFAERGGVWHYVEIGIFTPGLAPERKENP